MQEDKESVFDGADTVKKCLKVFVPMLESAKVLKANMYAAAKKGFINATDLADYLAKKGVPFRTAYKIVGELVGRCVVENKTLEDLTPEEYKSINPAFDTDLYDAINLENCVNRRVSEGGTGADSVQKQISDLKEFIKNEKNFY